MSSSLHASLQDSTHIDGGKEEYHLCIHIHVRVCLQRPGHTTRPSSTFSTASTEDMSGAMDWDCPPAVATAEDTAADDSRSLSTAAACFVSLSFSTDPVEERLEDNVTGRRASLRAVQAACVRVSVRVRIHTCAYRHVCMYICACTCMCSWMYTYMCIQACVHVHMCVYVDVFVDVYVHVHTGMCARV